MKINKKKIKNSLKIWDVMPPYLKTLFEQKQEIDKFEHFRLNDPLRPKC